ncbi:diguanylate cyclase domain-containing protein [Thermomonas sp.]|uniref:diguanylate cyclase domain-containing protein n=1 Tax=Thermomonas sp. TaxID=1971895 RepID=UPI0035B09F17
MNEAVPGAVSADVVFDSLAFGLAVVDADLKVRLWNRWMARHSGIEAGRALHADFMALFPQPLPAGFRLRLGHVIEYGLPAVLSSALHRSPLPLFQEPAGTGDAAPARMVQSVVMTPVAAMDGNRACLIQVSDASHSIRRERILLSHSEALKRQVVTDDLTRIHNRRFFDESFVLALQRVRRSHEPLSLFMIDIDYFKQYNDHYGHLEGDRVLKRVAAALMTQMRAATDVFARYGGEEFIMLASGIGAAMASAIAERLRESVQALGEPHVQSPVANCVTISVGVCTRVPQTDADGQALMAAADAALYRAKQGGRNRVAVD